MVVLVLPNPLLRVCLVHQCELFSKIDYTTLFEVATGIYTQITTVMIS